MRTLCLIFAFLAPTTLSLVCPGGQEVTENPWGHCDYSGQLLVNEDCSQGFHCIGQDGSGCLKVCGPDERLVTTEGSHFECHGKGSPAAKDALCPGVALERIVSPEKVGSNPLGTCRCDGELWVNKDCSQGFYCNGSLAEGGATKTCEQNQIVLVDLPSRTWECSNEVDKCTGGQVNGVGCPVPLCLYDTNPFGECGCDGQLFLGDNCLEGFFCTSNIPDPFLYHGCHKTCPQGQLLVPDIPNRDWSCKNPSDTKFRCPGGFNFECPENALKGNFTVEDCQCSGEYIISDDCRELFHCSTRFTNGGKAVTCGEGEIVEFDIDSHSYGCTSDLEQCPGLGGFRVGCRGNGIPDPPELQCKFDKNNLGTCGGCEGQIFVNEDCTETFYCSFWTPEPDQDGCHKKCDNGQVVWFDLLGKEWECLDRPEGFICPGEFQVDCHEESDFDIQCGCQNEVWLNQECNAAFMCSQALSSPNEANVGKYVSCPPGRIIQIDFQNPFNYTCTKDVEKCPGSFHFGCIGGDVEDLTTTLKPTDTSTTTSEVPNSGNSINLAMSVVIFILGVFSTNSFNGY